MPNNLKALRETRGLTQVAAAAALGTTRDYYIKLEKGSRRLSTPWIESAAKAFAVDPGEVVAGPKTEAPTVGRVVG